MDLISSHLLEYEIWNRINIARLGHSHGDAVRALLLRVDLIALNPEILARAVEPFPVKVRTLDALHLASLEFLRAHGQRVELASYDNRLLAAARALDIPIAALSA